MIKGSCANVRGLHPLTSGMAYQPAGGHHFQPVGLFSAVFPLALHHMLIDPPFPITPFTSAECLCPTAFFCYSLVLFSSASVHAQRGASTKHFTTPALWKKITGQNWWQTNFATKQRKFEQAKRCICQTMWTWPQKHCVSFGLACYISV